MQADQTVYPPTLLKWQGNYEKWVQFAKRARTKHSIDKIYKCAEKYEFWRCEQNVRELWVYVQNIIVMWKRFSQGETKEALTLSTEIKKLSTVVFGS